MSPRPQTNAADLSAAEDEKLVLRAAAGEAEAFDELMRRYYERIYSVVTRLVRDPDLALDLTQETFLRAWRGLSGFQAQASFFTWLYRVARNVVHSDQRRVMARPKIAVSLDQPTEESTGGYHAEALGADPADLVLSRERQEQLLAALESMIPDFREILLLRDVEQYSYEDIAHMLEIPVGTVRSRLHRARLELKGLLTRMAGEKEAEK